MSRDDWTVTVVTPGKLYRGKVHVMNIMDKRTLFLLNNSVKTTTSDSAIYAMDAFIQLDEVVIKMAGETLHLDTVAVKKQDIVFVYDEFERMGSEKERKRYLSVIANMHPEPMDIITRMRNRQCYRFTCEVMNLRQKMTSKEQFIALSSVSVQKLSDTHPAKVSSPLKLPFVALNKRLIESVHLRS